MARAAEVVLQLRAENAQYMARLRQSEAQFNRSLIGMQRQASATSAFLRGAFGSIVAALASGAAIREIKILSDAATRVDNALKVAGLSGAELEEVYNRLRASAISNAAPLESLITLFGRAAIVQKELGVSTQDLLKFTDNVATALRVAGTDAQSASGALLQLSQALGSGTVRAEEFNSILEGALPIAQAAAAGLKEAGGSVAKLRGLVVEGKVSSEAFFRAFEVGSETLKDKVQNSTFTIDQALNNLDTALLDTAREFNNSTGASERFAVGINNVADAIADFDVAGLIAKLQRGQTAMEKFLNGIGNADVFKRLNQALGLMDADGNVINLDLKTANDETKALEREIQLLQATIAKNTDLGFDNTEALARLDEVQKRLAKVREQASNMPVTVPAIPNQPFREPVNPPGTTFLDPITIEDYPVNGGSSADEKSSVSSLADALTGYIDRTIAAESGGDRFARNPRSSAEGLGQFIDDTWLRLFKRYFPGEAKQLSDPAILALKTTADYSKRLIAAYGAENAKALEAAGIAVRSAADEYKLHLAHFLGVGGGGARTKGAGAIELLQAAPGTPVSQILSPGAIRANPEVLSGNKTREDVIAYGELRAGLSSIGTQQLDSRENFEGRLAAYRQLIEMKKEETGLMASLNPLIEDYGRGLTTLQAAQELLALAQEEGTAAGRELSSAQQLLTGDLSSLTPEAREQALAMRELAEASGKVDASANELRASQADLRDVINDTSSAAKDIFGGFLSDLREGKSASEALGNALGKLGDKLADMSLDLLFGGGIGGNSGGLFGKLLGGLFSGFGGGAVDPWAGLRFAEGGHARKAGRVRGLGGPKGDKIPAMLSDGEHVTRAAMAKKHGHLLDLINADRVPGFAEGTPAAMPPMPRMPAPARMAAPSGPSFNQSLSYQIDARGSQMTEAQFRSILNENNKTVMRDTLKALPGKISDLRLRGVRI